MAVALFNVVGGLVLLLGGGELLLRGAVGLAHRWGLSPLLIGLTVVAAATSMPELVVAVTSGLRGVPDIGVGNVIGSNTANILLILGAAAVISPIATRRHHVVRDGMAVLGATLVFVLFAFAGRLSWPHGCFLLILLASYLGFAYWHDRKHDGRAIGDPESVTATPTDAKPMGMAAVVFWIGLGVAGLGLGSTLLVDGGTVLARGLGVSDAVIGLTVVAVGTSLPELATALIAGARHNPEVALGNVLGSNLFNLLAIIGVLALTVPFRVADEMLGFDI